MISKCNVIFKGVYHKCFNWSRFDHQANQDRKAPVHSMTWVLLSLLSLERFVGATRQNRGKWKGQQPPAIEHRTSLAGTEFIDMYFSPFLRMNWNWSLFELSKATSVAKMISKCNTRQLRCEFLKVGITSASIGVGLITRQTRIGKPQFILWSRLSLGLFQRALCPLGPLMCPLGLSKNQ